MELHSNIWTALYLLSVPAAIFLLTSLILWMAGKKKRYVRVFLITGILLLFLPVSFIRSHIAYEKKGTAKRQGIYRVVKQESLDELCKNAILNDLSVTLGKNGDCSFNYKPCFAGRKDGRWKWQDDMVSTYAVFDMEIASPAYLTFDRDTLRLKGGGKTYLVFAKQAFK